MDANWRFKSNAPDETQASPPLLLAEVRRVYGRVPEVPAAVDRAILEEARYGFGRRRRFRLATRWAGAAAAVAAAVVVVVLNLRPDRPAAVLAGDVDRSGRVDMLDALALARKVEARTGTAPAWEDVNGDGALDRADVDRVAAIAVKLR